MSNIDQWDSMNLSALLERGAMSVREIMESNAIDQFEMDTAREWTESALARGLIEETGGSADSTRYNITDAGRAVIGKAAR